MTTQSIQNSLRAGLFGPVIVLALNLIGLFLLNQSAARFLSDDWWSVWFPAYLVAFGVMVIGSGCRSYFGKRDR